MSWRWGRGGSGSGRGRRQGRYAGIGRVKVKGAFTKLLNELCQCPACGCRLPRLAGQACSDQSCPYCGALMTKEATSVETQ